jgi:hypothetical protein
LSVIMRTEKRPDGWTLWGRWVLVNALAEMIGLGASALLTAGFFIRWEEQLGLWLGALVVILGSAVLEGTAVGLGQWLVLRSVLPWLKARTWWLATAAGAFMAWTLGMIPSTLMNAGADAGTTPAPEMSDWLVYGLAALMGLVLGPVLGVPQWLVLRRHVARAGWWVIANAVAWVAGMAIIFFVVSLVPAGDLTPATVVIVLGGLALAGAVVGAIHGIALVWLLVRSREPAT